MVNWVFGAGQCADRHVFQCRCYLWIQGTSIDSFAHPLSGQMSGYIFFDNKQALEWCKSREGVAAVAIGSCLCIAAVVLCSVLPSPLRPVHFNSALSRTATSHSFVNQQKTRKQQSYWDHRETFLLHRLVAMPQSVFI